MDLCNALDLVAHETVFFVNFFSAPCDTEIIFRAN